MFADPGSHPRSLALESNPPFLGLTLITLNRGEVGGPGLESMVRVLM